MEFTSLESEKTLISWRSLSLLDSKGKLPVSPHQTLHSSLASHIAILTFRSLEGGLEWNAMWNASRVEEESLCGSCGSVIGSEA